MTADSSILKSIQPKEKDLGEFKVRRSVPQVGTKSIGPWVFFDHFGPAEFEPGEGINVRPHPHINLATVSYLFEGEIFHRDSLGNRFMDWNFVSSRQARITQAKEDWREGRFDKVPGGEDEFIPLPK